MPARHIALVPEFGMNPSDLARVSAALQKQVTRDLEPIWQVAATVDSFPALEDVPAGYWPIILTFRAIGSDAGIHVDRNGQPFAMLEITPSWSLTASHVCLEMITDPFGSRTFPGPSPRPEQGDVEFLGAICDPCEHAEFAYLINDVLVSDFCTPAFWDPAGSSRDRRSFTGAIQAPYQVLPGGHLSWYDPATDRWWLRRLQSGVLSDVEVGTADPEQGSVRDFMGRHSPHLAGTKMTLDAFETRVGMRRQRALRASQSRAFWLRAAFSARPAEHLELDGEVRAALGGPRQAPAVWASGARRSVAASDSEEPTLVVDPSAQKAVPGAAASEPAMTVDESALEPPESVIESEIAQALERVQGEIRGTTPPPPVVEARADRAGRATQPGIGEYAFTHSVSPSRAPASPSRPPREVVERPATRPPPPAPARESIPPVVIRETAPSIAARGSMPSPRARDATPPPSASRAPSREPLAYETAPESGPVPPSDPDAAVRAPGRARSVPPPLPQGVLPGPLPPPPPKTRAGTPVPVSVVPRPAFSSLPPGASIPPSAVSVAPLHAAAGPSKKGRDSRVTYVGVFTVAAALIWGLLVFRTADSPHAAASGAAEPLPPAAEIHPAPAPQPMPAPSPAAPAPVAASVAAVAMAVPNATPAPSVVMVPAPAAPASAAPPAAVTPVAPAAPAPVAVAPRPAAPAPVRSVAPRVAVALPAPRVVVEPASEPAPATRPTTAAAIDSLIDDRR